MTKEERALYASVGNDKELQLASCSHFRLGTKLMDEASPLDTVTDIHTFALAIEEQRTKQIHAIKGRIRALEHKDRGSEIRRLNDKINVIEAQQKYFTNAMAELDTMNTYRCSICWEDYDHKDQLAISNCGHYLCISCLQQTKSNICQTCRAPSKYVTTDIANIATVGTKLNRILEDVKRLVEADSTNRIIIFTQFHQLAKFIQDDLTKARLNSGHLHGSSAHRNNVLDNWSEKSPVLILTVQDSSAGLNLQAANHILFVNPLKQADESQAIGRCHRQGQDRQVHITRYVMKDTIEEIIYEKERNVGKRKAA